MKSILISVAAALVCAPMLLPWQNKKAGGGQQGVDPGKEGHDEIFLGPPPPVLDTYTSLTKESAVTITGSAPGPVYRVEVAGTASGVLYFPVSGGRFEAANLPLGENRVNHLFFRSISPTFDTLESTPVVAEVTNDNEAPFLAIDSPGADGEVFTTPTITVVGRVGDMLSGFMGLSVTVNGIEAVVDIGAGTNGTFAAYDVPLNLTGDTLIEAIARDTLGNTTTRSRTVVYQDPGKSATLTILSGESQSGQVGTLLPEPIRVRITSALRVPIPGKVVTFHVTRSDGRVAQDASGEGRILLQQLTDANGEASVVWRLGTGAGCSNNRLEITSTDVLGTGLVFASATPGPAKQINIGTGHNQVGVAGAQAIEPLEVWVNDGCNGIPGIDVAFSVTRGGGSLSESSVVTDATGHAKVQLTLGPDGGNNVVEANFPDHSGKPAVFNVFARTPISENTVFTGQVFDNSLLGIEGATCTLHVGTATELTALTDSEGRFKFPDVPESGLASLHVDGATATRVGGVAINPNELRFPSLHYEPTVFPHVRNALPRPVLLPRMNPANDVDYDGSQDIELMCEGIDGLRMFIEAGSMTLPDGRHPTPDNPLDEPVKVAVNQVHADDIPMPMPDGAGPAFAWTLQPGGARFDPPVRIEYPNMSGLPAGATTYFLSFNHDTSSFEIVASGRVVDNGSHSVSDPGSGITVAGWGCQCPPYPDTGECSNCLITGSSVVIAAEGSLLLFAPNADLSSGIIEWNITSGKNLVVLELQADNRFVLIRAGRLPSAALGDVVITMTYTPSAGIPCTDEYALTVIRTAIEKVVSRQLAMADCNRLPPPAHADENMPMLMGAPTTTEAAGKVELFCSVEPQAAIGASYVRAKAKLGILNLADVVLDAESVLLPYPIEGFSKTVTFAVGLDANGDGRLDENELVSEISGARVIVQSDYQSAINFVILETVAFPGIAKSFIRYFLGEDVVPEGAELGNRNVASTELTHPVGVNWSSDCNDALREFVFGVEDDISVSVAESSPVENLVEMALASHRDAVQNYFDRNLGVDEAIFPDVLGQQPWEWGGTLSTSDWLLALQFEIAFAWGGLHIAGEIPRVRVQRNGLSIEEIRYVGGFMDIYDFNFYGDRTGDAAKVQIGYPTQGPSGRVFASRVSFERTATEGFDFD